MTHELAWTEEADEVMTRIETDPMLAPTLRSLRRVLGRLQLDPADPKLHTRQYVTEDLGHICSTPVPGGDWKVLWHMSDVPNELTIRALVETTSL